MITEAMWGKANLISVIAGLAADAILVAWFYSLFLKKKRRAVFTGVAYFLAMALLYISPIIFAGTIAYALGIASVCLVSILIDRDNIPQKIFLSMTVYLLEWISSEATLLPWKWIGRITYLNETVHDPGRQFVLYIAALVLYVSIQTAVFYAEIRLISWIYADKKEQMEWRELFLLISPYAALIAGYWISSFMADAYEHSSGGYIWTRYPAYDYIRPLYSFIALLTVITTIHSYIRIRAAQEETLQNTLIARQIDELSGHIHAMENIYSDIRGMRHEINGHVMVLGNLLKNEQNEEALSYLNDWQEGFPVPELDTKTGNPVTDIILSEKRREAGETGIAFMNGFHYPANGKVESIDIGVILNNALSNAIRGATGSDHPRVEIRSWMNRNVFMIEIRNTMSGALPPFSGDGYPSTTKEDAAKHGYGMKNMKRIAEKYFGTVSLDQENGMAVFTAMLMIAG